MNIRFLFTPVLTALFLLWVPSNAFPGAWTQPKGTQYNKVSFSFFWSTHAYDIDGDVTLLSDNGEFQDWNLCWYQEYGILDYLTIITSIPYKYVRYEDNNLVSDTWGLGDGEIGGKVLLLGNPFVMSLQTMLKVPLGYEKDEVVPIGNDQVDAEVRLLFGKSLYPVPAYAGAEIGYRVRGEDPSDEIRYLVEFGYTFVPWLSGRLKLDGALSVGNGREEKLTPNLTLTNEYNYGKLEITASFKVRENVFIEGTWTPTLYGENTSHGHNFSLAVTTICQPGELLKKLFKE